MPESTFRGPLVSLGQLLDGSALPTNPFDGPSIFNQGSVFPDPRLNNPAAKDAQGPGTIPGFLQSVQVQVIDQIPSTNSSTTIAIAQVATSGTPMTLATTAPGGAVAGTPSWATGVPIIPTGTTVATTTNAIDFGFTTGTTASNSSTVVVVDSTLFSLGQWVVIGGAANAGKTASLPTQVVSVGNATTINISPVAVGALDNAPIGQGNLFSNLTPPGTQFGPSTASANAAVPYRVAGAALAFDPVQAIARNLVVAAATANGGTATILAVGYDIYGAAMTELFTCSGTTVQQGKKAFKYVSSLTPTASGSATYTVGVGDIYGIHIRTDKFTQLSEVAFGTNLMATSAGWTSAITAVASNTTGDVRGTINIQALGGAIGTSNGTSRLGVTVTVPLIAVLNAVPSQATSLLGVPQA